MGSKSFIDSIEFSIFFTQLDFNIAAWENIFEIDPVFLHHQPIIDNEHGVKDDFL